MPMRSRSLLLISILVTICKAATDDSTPLSKYNALRYIPSIALTSVALALYIPVTVAMFFLIFTKGAKHMLWMAAGALCYCIGLALRYPFRSHPYGLGLFVVMNTFTVLSPCALIAAIYMLLGRLARELGMGKHLLVNPNKLTRYFVLSDFLTLGIQGTTPGLLVSKTKSTQNLGKTIFLIGLVLQFVSFGFFTSLCLIWMHKVRKHSQNVWLRDEQVGKPWYQDWRAMAGAILVSCMGVLVRSIFRVVENSEGLSGPLTTTESYFYILDSLPLLIAIAVYIPFWPANYISDSQLHTTPGEENPYSHELTAGGYDHSKPLESGGERNMPATVPVLRPDYAAVRNTDPQYSG
ncbi:hypothetical protein FRB94_002406 [Tulasnella sp. JGI-2019a]|nr:hypothetical protein FRB94_002406 [Tulasnella sp. JGI-2019a]KAG9006469.1 hypothetical protein FRB93_008597 [Tulasnella sp. JGI-2019a]KAG9036391.1 hypothetical protein FRB95_008932 [Tulasnella sp. JGI-2019a]